MLALTHHFIIQLAYFLEYRHKAWFRKYLILGDDIVILDKRVAHRYHSIMVTLGVEINLSKSLVSPKGYAEFAKRFVRSDADLSGVSLREFSSLYSS